MPKFRPWDKELARREHEADMTEASRWYARIVETPNGPDLGPLWAAEMAIRTLKRIVDDGLMVADMNKPSSMQEFLFDFYPGLSRVIKDNYYRCLRLILNDVRFAPINAALREQHDFDMQRELEAALAAPWSWAMGRDSGDSVR